MIYAFLALIPYVVFLLLNRYLSQRIGSILFVTIVNVVSIFIPLSMVITSQLQKKANVVSTHGHGQWYALSLFAGLCIGIYGVLLSKAFATTNVAVVSPIFAGGAVALTAIGAYVFFGEKINALQLVGLLLVFAGLGFIVLSKVRA